LAFWNKIFQRGRSRADPLPTGRVTVAGINKNSILSPYRSRQSDILSNLRNIREEAEAIDFLKRVNPDVSMALWNFLRLSNQGHKMHFYESKNKERRMPEVESMWQEFASRVNEVSNAGLDGLVDILHQMAFMRGAQAVEVEINKARNDIVDVHPVVPQTIQWEIEERDGRRVWIPYQQQMMKKVSLEKGKANFFWVPTDPDPDDPRGNLIMVPVLDAIDFQMQILQDLAAVLHHQGWPRNDIKLLMERIMQEMPAEIQASPTKQREWLNERWQEIKDTMNNLEPDDDYIHWDDVEINLNQGGNTNRSLDVRAIAELVDTQTFSGAKQMAIFMNRNQGITETWGTVQFMIFCSGIASVQRGSKRLIEEVGRLWLRVKGIQGVPYFEYNKVDWQSEEQKVTVKLMWQEFWAIAQLMGWVDADKAASESVDVEKAKSDTPSENIRVSFSAGGKQGGEGDGDKNDGKGGVRNAGNILRLWK